MKTQFFIFLLLPFLITNCSGKKNKMLLEQGKLDKISECFIEWYFGLVPDNAVIIGLHDYDGRVPDRSPEEMKKSVGRLKELKQDLLKLDTSLLNTVYYDQYRFLRQKIADSELQLTDLKVYATNPLFYLYPAYPYFFSSGIDITYYVLKNYKPVEDRLKDIIKIEKGIPEYLENAKRNLNDTLPRPLVEMAMNIASGTSRFLEKDLLIAFREIKNDTLISQFKEVNTIALDAYRNFAFYLEKEKLPKSTTHFAIGPDNYRKMLQAEGINLTSDQILKRGLEELEKEELAFEKAARIIDPGNTPADVNIRVMQEHPRADSLISVVKASMLKIREFINQKDLLSMPVETMPVMKETPEYLRSGLGAAMDGPGLLEKGNPEVYYYVTPPDIKWTDKEKEDWLSVFNYYTVDFITIHEAFPGHYVKAVLGKNLKGPLLEKAFLVYSTDEGWAHYCEKMMIEEGYGQNSDSITAAKYRMCQASESIFRLCRLIVSIKMHCEGMTIDEATQFFMEKWHQGEKPCRLEVLRGAYEPQYLYYSLGKLMILKLRDDYRKQEGEKFELKKFNDLVVQNGLLPITILREKLLKDKKIWKEII